MGRPTKEALRDIEDHEEMIAHTLRIDDNQKRIAAESRDPRIIANVNDSRHSLEIIRQWIIRRYPGKERRKD